MRKPVYFITAALLLPLTAAFGQSQTTKGTRTLGIASSDSYYDSDSYSSALKLSVAPSVGKFFADNWAFGVAVPVSYYHRNFKMEGNRSHNVVLGLAPWLRYYIPSESRHRLFAEAQTGVLADAYWGRRSVYDPIVNDRTEKYNGVDAIFLLGLGAGYSYFLTPNIAVEGQLQYGIGVTNMTSGALGLTVGLRAYLGQ
jgi:Outer membrane protein beta-barrel domain